LRPKKEDLDMPQMFKFKFQGNKPAGNIEVEHGGTSNATPEVQERMEAIYKELSDAEISVSNIHERVRMALAEIRNLTDQSIKALNGKISWDDFQREARGLRAGLTVVLNDTPS